MVLDELYSIIDLADRLVVKVSPSRDAKTLFESRERQDLDDLRESLVIEKPKEEFHCMCIGTPAIYLYKADKQILELTNHHGMSVRCSLWGSDAPIIDTERWLTWFDERNISGPRIEVEEIRAQEEQRKRDWDRWVAAMPDSLKPVWSNSLGQYRDVNVAPLTERLARDVPHTTERILLLLKRFGSGAGPWSGFPSYEVAAEEMLLQFETEDIIAAIQSTTLTKAQTEGAARLLGGWQFSQQRPKALKTIPPGLKRLLWAHVEGTENHDKLRRAKRAFGE